MSYLDPIKQAQAAQALRDSLAAVSADDDETLVLDSIEGETGLFEALDILLSRMTSDRAMLLGIAQVSADLDERKRRVERRIETHRALIEQALMIADLSKLERPAATLSLSPRPAKVIVETEADIPAEFWKTGEPTLDKKALNAALKAGRTVSGCCLSNAAPSLTIRTK